jgi:large subunit ribosomal protein L4
MAPRASICSAAAGALSVRTPAVTRSAKAKDGGILVIEALSVKEAKTKALRGHFDKLGLSNALFIDGAEVTADVRKAARNFPNIDVLPVAGINVYDIMRRNKLVLTRAALDALEARFK